MNILNLPDQHPGDDGSAIGCLANVCPTRSDCIPHCNCHGVACPTEGCLAYDPCLARTCGPADMCGAYVCGTECCVANLVSVKPLI